MNEDGGVWQNNAEEERWVLLHSWDGDESIHLNIYMYICLYVYIWNMKTGLSLGRIGPATQWRSSRIGQFAR